jgi:hypothetical protein
MWQEPWVYIIYAIFFKGGKIRTIAAIRTETEVFPEHKAFRVSVPLTDIEKYTHALISGHHIAFKQPALAGLELLIPGFLQNTPEPFLRLVEEVMMHLLSCAVTQAIWGSELPSLLILSGLIVCVSLLPGLCPFKNFFPCGATADCIS